MYQQNHLGVYRSDDYGASWDCIDKGLPYDFGFPIAINPHDPETCYVIPLEPRGYSFRATPGKMAVYQRNGKKWKALTNGLPANGAYISVLREGMGFDSLKPCGIYVGTSSGSLFVSGNAGKSWRSIADHLPRILSVEAAVV